MQLGYVVRDIDAAISQWTKTLGVGPFFVTHAVTFESLEYKGRVCNCAIDVALSSHNGMQIELIQQTSDDPSIFSDFLERRGGGLHHVCALTDDLAADINAWRDRGVGVLQGGRATNGIPFAYLDTDPDDHGRVLELVEPSPGLLKFSRKIESAVETWDGTTARIDV